jgi:hypothetical protein
VKLRRNFAVACLTALPLKRKRNQMLMLGGHGSVAVVVVDARPNRSSTMWGSEIEAENETKSASGIKV